MNSLLANKKIIINGTPVLVEWREDKFGVCFPTKPSEERKRLIKKYLKAEGFGDNNQAYKMLGKGIL